MLPTCGVGTNRGVSVLNVRSFSPVNLLVMFFFFFLLPVIQNTIRLFIVVLLCFISLNKPYGENSEKE